MFIRNSLLFCGLALCGTTITGQASAQYLFSTFDGPITGDTEAYGVNTNRVVTGYYALPNGNTAGFTYQAGLLSTVNVPLLNGTSLFQINNAGLAAATYGDVNGVAQPATYNTTNQTFTYLPTIPNSTSTFAAGINNTGAVAGTYTTNPNGFSDLQGWIYKGSAYSFFNLPGGDSFYINILSLNDAGEIVTTVEDGSSELHGLLIDGGTDTQIDVPGAASTFAFGINNDGEIVGRYKLNGVIHGYLDINGQFTTIDVPGAADTW